MTFNTGIAYTQKPVLQTVIGCNSVHRLHVPYVCTSVHMLDMCYREISGHRWRDIPIVSADTMVFTQWVFISSPRCASNIARRVFVGVNPAKVLKSGYEWQNLTLAFYSELSNVFQTISDICDWKSSCLYPRLAPVYKSWVFLWHHHPISV